MNGLNKIIIMITNNNDNIIIIITRVNALDGLRVGLKSKNAMDDDYVPTSGILKDSKQNFFILLFKIHIKRKCCSTMG